MIIYYPVSALVTLFANILQNPNDARARSDIKLMNVVVNFLSTLVSDESNGSIKRMLSLCSEFERIAKTVIDRAEKESHSKKKRKMAPDQNTQQNENSQDGKPGPSTSNRVPPGSMDFSPPMFPNGMNDSPGDTTTAPESSGIDLPSNIHNLPNYGQNLSDMVNPGNMGTPGFPDQSQFTTPSIGSPNMPFQQSFIPQDIWQIPMPLEWDWADMSTGFPVFDTGMDPGGP